MIYVDLQLDMTIIAAAAAVLSCIAAGFWAGLASARHSGPPASHWQKSAKSDPGKGLSILIRDGELDIDGLDDPDMWPLKGTCPANGADLIDWARTQRGDLSALLHHLLEDGEAFETLIADASGGWQRVAGRPVGLQAQLDIMPATPAEQRLIEALEDQRIRLADTEAMIERGVAHPVAAFEITPKGDISWSNRAARQILDIGQGPASLRAVPPRTQTGLVPLESATGRRLGWGRVDAVGLKNGNRLVSVQDASAERRAEDLLRSFTATLTETFAHLDIALVIFDGRRQLSVFNPAAGDILDLTPAQMAARPGLREFLDLLRSRQKVPEQRNFTLWRNTTISRMEDAGDRPFMEDWTLTGGQVLRVSARPHAGSGIALVIEDITGAVQVERRYVAEVESGQAALDSLSIGVAILGQSGEMVFANPAFAAVLGLPDDAGRLGVDELAARLGLDRAEADMVRAFVLSGRDQDRMSVAWDGPEDAEGPLMLNALPDGTVLLQLPPGIAVAADAVPQAPVGVLTLPLEQGRAAGGER